MRASSANQREPDVVASEPDQQFSLSQLFRILRLYRAVIGVSLLAIAAAYLIGSAIYILRSPVRRVTTMPFRLQFRGSESGHYPNGSLFTTGDITSPGVLMSVYQKNDLKDYLSYSDFSASIYVVESSSEYERLNREYGAKLVDARLPPTERDRLEREYRDKVAALGKFDYAITMVIPSRVRHMPRTVRRKILGDVLSTWAHEATEDKKVLQYAVPVFSTNLLRGVTEKDVFLRRVLLLRQRIAALLDNVNAVGEIPHAQVVRTGPEKISLAEIRMELEDLARYDVLPLISAGRGAGLIGERDAAIETLAAQLAFDERNLQAARARETALRNAFLTYDATPQQTQAATPSGSDTPREATDPSREAVMPQLSDTFLERIVDLANRNADRAYRQKLIEDLKGAALAVIPAEAAVAADRALLEEFRSTPASSDPARAAEVQQRWAMIVRRSEVAIQRINEIHTIASRYVNSQTELYRVTAPSSSAVERAVDYQRVVLLGVVLMMMSIPLIVAGCLIHNRLREEQAQEQAHG